MFSNLNLQTELDLVNVVTSEVDQDEIYRSIFKFSRDVDELSIAIEDYEALTKNEIKKEWLLQKSSHFGISVEDINLNVENLLSDLINNVRDKIKDIWNRIIYFFKKVWVKIQAWYFNITKDIFNLRKNIYGLRNKSPICIDVSLYEEFVSDFYPYFTLKNVANEDDLKNSYNFSIALREYINEDNVNKRLNFLKEFTNLLKDISKLDQNSYKTKLMDIFNKYGEDKNSLLYELFEEDKFKKVSFLITSMELGNKEINYITYGFDKPKIERYKKNNPLLYKKSNDNVRGVEYTCLARLSETIDAIKGIIVNVQSDVFNLEKQIHKTNINNKDMDFINMVELDIFSVSSQLCFNYVRNILEHIKVVTKWIKIYHKAAKGTTLLGIREEYEIIRNSKPGKYKIPNTEVYIQEPYEVKLVEDGDMAYFTMSDRDWESLYKAHHVIGGFCVLTNSELSDSQIRDIKHPDDTTNSLRAARSINYKKAELGLIFIDAISVKTRDGGDKAMFDLTSDLSFIYYHELGHLLTGQHEAVLKIKKNIDRDDIAHYFKYYAYSDRENRADAYACLKTGITPEMVSSLRHSLCLKYIDKSLQSIKLLDDLKDVERDMCKNIRKEMGRMKKYADLTLLEYIRSSFINFKKETK